MKLEFKSQVDGGIASIMKSIANNLRYKDRFVASNNDTAQVGIELKPPVSLLNCKYVFDNSSYVAKCCRILAKDIILNQLTLVNKSDKKYEEVIAKIEENLKEYITELYYMLIDIIL